MSNSLDPDQAGHFVRPYLGRNCLQRLSADEELGEIRFGIQEHLNLSNNDTIIRMHKNEFSYFSTETYVVGTQKNRLNETVLLITQNTC